jgi:altronate hydrolase
MTSPRTIWVSTDGNAVIAINLVNRGDTAAGLTARERILRDHKMAIERSVQSRRFLQMEF